MTSRNIMIGLSVFSVILVGVGWSAFSIGERNSPKRSTASDYMVVSLFSVKDAEFGEDPKFILEREVKRKFSANWTVEVGTSDQAYRCSATGSSNYGPDEILEENLTLFGWYMHESGVESEDQCLPGMFPLPVGCYTVSTTWDVYDDIRFPTSIFSPLARFCVREEEK